MNQQIVKDIKRICREARKEQCFHAVFERKLAHYIRERAPRGSVHWFKLRYEFRSIYRKCRDHNRSLKTYLKAMGQLAEAALAGNHKQAELDLTSLRIISES